MSDTTETPPRNVAISSKLIDHVCKRLLANKPVRQILPEGGMLHIDRQLPFLCVYRPPSTPDEGTSRLVSSEASYLIAPRTGSCQRLVHAIAQTVATTLGSFLLLEVWSSQHPAGLGELDPLTGESLLPRPAFRIVTRRVHRPEGSVAMLEFSLQRLKANKQLAEVRVDLSGKIHPPGMKPLIRPRMAEQMGWHLLGLEVRPVFRDPVSGDVYDRELRTIHRQVARAMKKAFFSFALTRTTVRPEHYFSLGTRKLAQQVYTVDHQLADVSGQFKFLLLVTPINAERSWHEFSGNGFRGTPVFHYRLLGVDPMLIKRRLMKIGTERVDDPTLAHLLRETQSELDRQLTMLGDIGTPQFLAGSLQVFGAVESELLELARHLLQRVPRRGDDGGAPALTALQFARMANREIKYYRDQSSDFRAEALVRDDLYSGLLATGGNLLIGHETSIVKRRASALLQHEVGTHLVTYYNGAAQPLRLLRVGLAGYEGFQEGLAVLAEYLVGGLSPGRMRTLAARVIAADQVVQGAPFDEVFEQLVDGFGFEPRTAYTIVLRVYRGGGLTKDALYLRGLVEMLKYVGNEGDLEILCVGKLAHNHIPVVRELLLRGVLRPPQLQPRYLRLPDAKRRLAEITARTTVLDLIDNVSGE